VAAVSALLRRPWLAALVAALGGAAVAASAYGALWEPPAATFAVARAGAKIGWIVLLVLVLWQSALGVVAGAEARKFSAGNRETDGGLSFAGIMGRTLLVCAVPLPRYLADPAGGIVAGLWLLVILPCGFVYVEHAVRGRPGLARLTTWYWLAWALLLAPWSLPALSTTWPPGGAF
jgi:hypothetical protein